MSESLSASDVEVLLADERSLAEPGRQILGIAGRRERVPAAALLRNSIGARLTGAALLLLTLADAAATTVAGAVAEAARPTFGGSGIGAAVALYPLIYAAGGMLGLALYRLRVGRALLAKVAAGVSALALAGIATATTAVAAFLFFAALDVASGVLAAVLLPMLTDAFRPEIRGRVIGCWAAALTVGVAVPGLALAVFRGQEWSWRGAVLLLVILPVSALAAAWRLDDPALGRHDRDRIRRLVDARLGVERAVHPDDHSLTTFAQLKIVATSHSALAALSAAVAFGVFTWVLPMPVNSFFRDRWGMFEGSSQLLYSGCCLAAAIGVLWFAGRAEVAYRWSPRHLLRIGSNAALLGAVALAAAVTVPLFGLALVGLVVSFIAFGAMFVVAALTLMVLSEPERRPYAAVLIASAVAAGDVLGTATFNTIGDRFGVIWGLLAVTVFPLSAAGRLSQAVTSVDEDVTSTVNRMVESHDLAVRVSLGQHLPLLSCRNLDFAYTDVQVLFDVSLTVDDGEMVALLGTNGAGKSTLLRLISGLELPRAGSLHYRGADITYLGTDRRVQMGISQIPGGRAVFGSLTVVDNLRAYGHSLGLGRSQLDAALDRAFEALPRLGERRNQLASTLSGGEQQMVALGKAYLLKPRLLLIDELSLGLAPKIVGELLEMVRQINADGTAVVLVEQSVNIALGIVDHAYFMEKGAIRFDGGAADLLARPDLLRSVFLQGAAKGLSMAAAR